MPNKKKKNQMQLGGHATRLQLRGIMPRAKNETCAENRMRSKGISNRIVLYENNSGKRQREQCIHVIYKGHALSNHLKSVAESPILIPNLLLHPLEANMLFLQLL